MLCALPAALVLSRADLGPGPAARAQLVGALPPAHLGSAEKAEPLGKPPRTPR